MLLLSSHVVSLAVDPRVGPLEMDRLLGASPTRPTAALDLVQKAEHLHVLLAGSAGAWEAEPAGGPMIDLGGTLCRPHVEDSGTLVAVDDGLSGALTAHWVARLAPARTAARSCRQPKTSRSRSLPSGGTSPGGVQTEEVGSGMSQNAGSTNLRWRLRTEDRPA
jgi:hypothetical protein